MKEKIEEYIIELDESINALNIWLDKHANHTDVVIANKIGRLKTLFDVKNDLQYILNKSV